MRIVEEPHGPHESRARDSIPGFLLRVLAKIPPPHEPPTAARAGTRVTHRHRLRCLRAESGQSSQGQVFVNRSHRHRALAHREDRLVRRRRLRPSRSARLPRRDAERPHVRPARRAPRAAPYRGSCAGSTARRDLFLPSLTCRRCVIVMAIHHPYIDYPESSPASCFVYPRAHRAGVGSTGNRTLRRSRSALVTPRLSNSRWSTPRGQVARFMHLRFSPRRQDR